MSNLMDDREPFPDHEDPANDADLLGSLVDPKAYLDELQAFLHETAETTTLAEDEEGDETP